MWTKGGGSGTACICFENLLVQMGNTEISAILTGLALLEKGTEVEAIELKQIFK